MQTLSINLPRELSSVKIYPISDLHIGDRNCKIDYIKSLVASIAEDDGAFVILNGDLINNATKQSLSDCYSDTMTPMETLEFVCDILTPIKDKIIAVSPGNHEMRTWKTDGIDLTKIIAREFGVPYFPEGGVLFIRLGEIPKKESSGSGENRQVCYTIFFEHGSGGGRKEGAKINRLVEMESIVDCDIYVMGHTHLPAVLRTTSFRTDVHNSKVQQVEHMFINTASALDYGGYGAIGLYKPNSFTSPVIYLSGTHKKFDGIL